LRRTDLPSKESYRLCTGLRNWSETKRFTDVPCSKWEQQERERERESEGNHANHYAESDIRLMLPIIALSRICITPKYVSNKDSSPSISNTCIWEEALFQAMSNFWWCDQL
jgi:hypothetical protein